MTLIKTKTGQESISLMTFPAANDKVCSFLWLTFQHCAVKPSLTRTLSTASATPPATVCSPSDRYSAMDSVRQLSAMQSSSFPRLYNILTLCKLPWPNGAYPTFFRLCCFSFTPSTLRHDNVRQIYVTSESVSCESVSIVAPENLRVTDFLKRFETEKPHVVQQSTPKSNEVGYHEMFLLFISKSVPSKQIIELNKIIYHHKIFSPWLLWSYFIIISIEIINIQTDS